MAVSGNATKAYDPKRVKLAERELIYLRRAGRSHPVIVVLDRVESTNPMFEKRFLLHTVNPPKLRGNLAVVENGGGRLSSLTVLPERARIEAIGGPGREAWVNGTNYPYDPKAKVSAQSTPGAWRLEVAPGEPRTRDTFLHVLFVDDSTAAPVDASAAQLVKTGDAVGVRLGSWSVMFPLAQGAAPKITQTKP
jgi:heparin/heparan-sulfate lyase